MSKYEDMTNDQILIEIKKMEVDYENLKHKIIKDLDRLDAMELDCKVAVDVITKRLKINK